MINTKLQNIIDTKSAIGNAIVNKGGTITSETPFYNYAAQIDGISTGGGAYSTFVAQDQDNAKYTVYSGFEFFTNPTPNLSNNFAFNQWVLNNSATGDVILQNVITSQIAVATFQNNSVGINESYLPFVGNTVSYGGNILSITTNNGFIYAGGGTNQTVQKFNEATLEFVGNTNDYGGTISNLAINNGFIYAGGATNFTVQKFNESTLAFVNNTVSYDNTIRAITTNNGFIYVGGQTLFGTNRGFSKFHEGNLVLVGNTINYGGSIGSIAINNGFIYVGGSTADVVRKYNESTLALVGNTATYGNDISAIAINNGFIYVGGQTLVGTNRGVTKYHESNLALVGANLINSSTVNYGGPINELVVNNGFIYVGGSTNQRIQKFYEDNLAFVTNTNAYGGNIVSVKTNNGFIYAGGLTNQTVQKYVEQSNNLVETPIFGITTIKE
jgi:stage V sporulation protein SpoVS